MPKHVCNILMFKLYIFAVLLVTIHTGYKEDADLSLTELYQNRVLRGIAVQVTKSNKIVYNFNIGTKNDKEEPIDNNTVVKIASLSKSYAAFALMQLVDKQGVTLTTPLSDILGYSVQHPLYPNTSITLEMIMSHTSSIVDCDPNYIRFLSLTGSAKTGLEVPLLKDLLNKDGKYYGECLFSSYKPGTHFEYANFNYGIIGTVVQIISGVRFDEYQRINIQKYLASNQDEISTFAAWTLKRASNLATLYRGDNGKWVPQTDYYPSGVIPVRNLTDYKIGTNGVLFSPQAGLRASTTHMCNYMMMLANGGITIEGVRILSEESVKEMLKPRYQFHGPIGGDVIQYQNYGFGIYKTSMKPVDRIIPHEVVYGHIGESYGLLSGYYFWKDFTFSFYFSGNMNGYINNTGTMYEQERMTVHSVVSNLTKELTIQLMDQRKQLI